MVRRSVAPMTRESRRECSALSAELLLLLLFLAFSALVANPKKLLYTVANPARDLLNREKKRKKSGSAPSPRALKLVRRKIIKKNHAAHPHV